MRLTDRKLKNIRQPGIYSDGPGANGLRAIARLLVDGALSIMWAQRVYVRDPKTRKTIRRAEVRLGLYPEVSLQQAREIAWVTQKRADRGIDPSMRREGN